MCPRKLITASLSIVFFVFTPLVFGFWASFVVDIPTINATLGSLESSSTDFTISKDFSFANFTGETPYQINSFSHCNQYDDNGECIDSVPSLCPYISLEPKNEEITEIGFTQNPLGLQATGKLNHPTDDTDKWTLLVKSPCFEGECPANYDYLQNGAPLPQSSKGKTFKCDIEVYASDPPDLVQNFLKQNIAYAAFFINTNMVAVSAVLTGEMPGCASNCFSNVLFLPGIMGSRLYDPGFDCGEVVTGSECGEKELWISTDDALQEKLALNTQGKSINNVYTKNDTQNTGELDETGIVDDVSTFNIYQSFITDLKNWKQDGTIADYAFIPYDWRLSLDDIITNGATSTNNNLSYASTQNFSESFILKKLEALQKNSKSGKVTIIAHSNGGLVAKALIQKLKDTNNPLYDKIDKVIFVAVPQVGTPDALKSLLHGDKIGWGPIGMNAERERNLAQNMPTAYNLLPSKEYFNSINTTVPLVGFDSSPYYANSVVQYGYAINNYIELQNYLKNSEGRPTPSYLDLNHANTLNDGLIQNSEIIHDLLDAWVPSSNTKIIEVAGWGEYTLGGIGYRTEKECTDKGFIFEGLKLIYTCLAYKDKQALSTTDTLGGDGTVIDESAHYLSNKNISNTEKWWVDLAGYNYKESIFLNINHKDILEVPGLLDLIKYKIKDSIENSSFPYVSQVKPSSNKPYTRIQLNSPLTLDLYDSLGNHTGLTVGGEIEENIPGSRYKTIGESKYILVPKDISTNLQLKGYQEGSFSLSIDSLLGDEKISSTIFSAIPSSSTTLVTMDLPANTEVSALTPLVIDFNGDEVIDKQLIPKPNEEVIYDTSPPELQVTFDINARDVVFSAQDIIDKNPTTNITKDSTILKDNSNNTTTIPFIKFKEKPTRLRFSYNTIIRNGITTTVPNTNIVYDWQEKKGILTDLDTKITIKGVEKYIFNYKKKNNITIIKEKTSSGIAITTKPGFVVVNLKTNEDNLNVSY